MALNLCEKKKMWLGKCLGFETRVAWPLRPVGAEAGILLPTAENHSKCHSQRPQGASHNSFYRMAHKYGVRRVACRFQAAFD